MRREIQDQYGLNYLTLTIVDWVDIFTRKECRDIVIESLKYCQEAKGLELYSYVIMSNHVHLVAKAKEESKGLSALLRDFKKFTAGKLIEFVKNSGKESRREWILHRFEWNARKLSNQRHRVWQSGNHPTAVYTPKVVWEKINYIHQNAVRSGLVEEAEDYVYSSAKNYVSGVGILEVEVYEGLVFL